MSPYKLMYVIVLVCLILMILEYSECARRRRRFRNRIRHRRMLRSNGTLGARRQEFVRRRLRKFRNRNGHYEGKLRLVDGRAEFEGNVEIYHNREWGNICDDEWDIREAKIVCQTLGFPDALKVTYNSHYGHVRHKYWMDNLYCTGTEKKLTDCRHDGWGKHDCENDEAAGLVCETLLETTTVPPTSPKPSKDAPKPAKKDVLSDSLQGKIKLRLRGGRIKNEGRVEVKLPDSEKWGLICGDDWSLLEAMVVCRQLGLKFAQTAPSTGYFGGNSSDIVLSGVKCTGNEDTIDRCLHDIVKNISCPGPTPNSNIAGVTCIKRMADLAPDIHELARSTHLEDKQLFFLQCAIEENCLSSSAYTNMETGYGWHLESRRLLRFTARIVNQGDDAFVPFLPKSHWQWHQCHMHYHSMEVFARYDITDANGVKMAEGHKASFCLEDNNCLPGVTPHYKCANFGDQGISPGCTDTYAYNIDCQWIDITDLPPGEYTFRLSVNPEMKVAEKTFDNNAAICKLYYAVATVWLGNCTVERPINLY